MMVVVIPRQVEAPVVGEARGQEQQQEQEQQRWQQPQFEHLFLQK